MSAMINKVNSIAVFTVIFSDIIWIELLKFPNQTIEIKSAEYRMNFASLDNFD
jgi:hypothetical protein